MLLEIKNLSAGYGDFHVLRDVSLTVNEGDIVALIGPNGAGKSTVLKSVMGLTTKTGGKILWKSSFVKTSEDAGADITNLKTHILLEEGIGFVPQGRLVFTTMNVLENLEMGAYLINHRETREKNLERVFGYFPVLKKKTKQLAGSLSGGEQQMLAIGRALMMTPELLMLDEPSLGLSPKAIGELFEKLLEIHHAGTTLMIVEQNVRLVLKHATRGYLLSSGTVRFEGSATELSSEKLMHEAYLA